MAPALGLPLVDKDDILDRLFDTKGVGDAAWRRRLSRESDVILRAEALQSNGAILAYCDTQEEAQAYRDALNDIPRQLHANGRECR